MATPSLHYTFEMTSERARAAEAELGAALWAQNERSYQRWRARMPWRPQLRASGLGLAAFALGLALLGALLASAPTLRLEFAAAAVPSLLFLILFYRADGLAQAIRSGTRRLVRRQAHRALAAVGRVVPYTIDYTLTGSRLVIEASAVGVSAEVPLEQMRLAIVAASLVCVFDRPFRYRPRRVVYVPGPGERQALEAVFVAHGVEILRLDGPWSTGSTA